MNVHFFLSLFKTAFGFFGLLGSILGAVISIFLIGLFILNVVNIIQKEPSQRRRLLVWITSLPMVGNRSRRLCKAITECCGLGSVTFVGYDNAGTTERKPLRNSQKRLYPIPHDALCGSDATTGRW